MRAKILLAHGDTQQLERVVGMLTGAGFDVVATPDGGDAFARFFEEQPDLVICSESLPVLDGPSFGRMIHSQAGNLPVVLLTRDPELVDSNEFLVLHEPLELEALMALVPNVRPTLKPVVAPSAAAPTPSPPASAEHAEIHQILVRFQRSGNLLALLDNAGLERIAAIAALQHRQADERVIREGDPCDGFYLVVDGEVRVTLAERDDQEVARLSAGGFFGEMALLSDQPRSASVWTCAPMQLLWFEKDAVLKLLDDYPGLREVLGGVAVQRAEENLLQALAGDDDVQRNLSQVLDGIGQVAVEGGPVAAAATSSGVGSDAAGSVAPAARGAASRWQALWLHYQVARLWAERHRFELGLVVGVLSGIVVASSLMLMLQSGAPVAPPPSETATAAPAVDESFVGPPYPPPTSEHAGVGSSPAGAETAAEGPPAPGPTPEPGVAAALAPAPTPPSETTPTAGSGPSAAEGSPGAVPERKVLRRHLLDAYKAKQFASAVKWGTEMRAAYSLDWEALLALAHAEREVGQTKMALQDYLTFVAEHPNYVVTDDAQFWAAELLTADGRVREARHLYELVAANPKSDFRTSAKTRLQSLK
ncbi:MAG: cyclic nucleotide-binding domain-containing protein [Deltaproteobacteria bacterium]|nr:cyclic nucleotide-binding domain-containing protein [Deltaproteobacteria bacterium]